MCLFVEEKEQLDPVCLDFNDRKVGQTSTYTRSKPRLQVFPNDWWGRKIDGPTVMVPASCLSKEIADVYGLFDLNSG